MTDKLVPQETGAEAAGHTHIPKQGQGSQRVLSCRRGLGNFFGRGFEDCVRFGAASADAAGGGRGVGTRGGGFGCTVQVRQVFGGGSTKIAGCYVQEGKLMKGCNIRVTRGSGKN